MTAEQLAADACAREPIHIPGSIQPHGALLVVASDGDQVLQASANAAQVLGMAAAPQRSRELDAALPDMLQAVAQGREGVLQQPLACGARLLQLSAHATSQGLVLELEPLDLSEMRTLDALYPRLRSFLDHVEGEDDVALLGR